MDGPSTTKARSRSIHELDARRELGRRFLILSAPGDRNPQDESEDAMHGGSLPQSGRRAN